MASPGETVVGAPSSSVPSSPPRRQRSVVFDPDITCHQIMPEILRKYHLVDDPMNYVLFVSYKESENENSRVLQRCLRYLDRLAEIYRQLKQENKTPMFSIHNIKDLPNPVAVALAENQKLMAEMRPTDSERSERLTADSSCDHYLAERGLAGYIRDEGHKGRTGLQDASGHAVAMYPHIAKDSDEFDVVVGNTFVIIGKTKTWWVCYRDYGTATEEKMHTLKSGWVPSGCMLEAARSYARADGATANGVPIPSKAVSCSVPVVVSFDYVAQTPDEVTVSKGDTLNVFKKYGCWMYVITSNQERGWFPNWLVMPQQRREPQPEATVSDIQT